MTCVCYIHTHVDVYIYIYVCVCVNMTCVCYIHTHVDVCRYTLSLFFYRREALSFFFALMKKEFNFGNVLQCMPFTYVRSANMFPPFLIEFLKGLLKNNN